MGKTRQAKHISLWEHINWRKSPTKLLIILSAKDTEERVKNPSRGPENYFFEPQQIIWSDKTGLNPPMIIVIIKIAYFPLPIFACVRLSLHVTAIM